MYFPEQTFLVAGISRSGVAAAEYLLSKHARVYLYDDVSDDAVREATEKLVTKGAHTVKKEELTMRAEDCDVLVLSPGIPVDHPLPVMFKRMGKAVVGEAELGARALRCPVVAVTGTNGKTTVVSLIEHILLEAEKRAVACGNIGKPLTACLKELGEDGIAVAEISSFQLETLVSLRPHVSVILNITEDHLNRHYTMENYIFLKQRLLRNSTESEYAVLNRDDPVVRGFAEKTHAKAVWFSLRDTADAYLKDDAIFWRGERVMSVSDLPLDGEHNVANALAAVCAAKLLGVRTEIAAAIRSFRGVKHRLSKVAEVDGVTFIDDSKATNVDAAVKAVACVKGETVLLVGGKDKGYSYEPLFEAAKRYGIVHIVIYGENAFRILEAAVKTDFTKVTLCRSFEMAVRIAFMTAKRGQNVLLSPASASFDAFKSYEERGDCFAELVRSLQKERGAGPTEAEVAGAAE